MIREDLPVSREDRTDKPVYKGRVEDQWDGSDRTKSKICAYSKVLDAYMKEKDTLDIFCLFCGRS